MQPCAALVILAQCSYFRQVLLNVVWEFGLADRELAALNAEAWDLIAGGGEGGAGVTFGDFFNGMYENPVNNMILYL